MDEAGRIRIFEISVPGTRQLKEEKSGFFAYLPEHLASGRQTQPGNQWTKPVATTDATNPLLGAKTYCFVQSHIDRQSVKRQERSSFEGILTLLIEQSDVNGFKSKIFWLRQR